MLFAGFEQANVLGVAAGRAGSGVNRGSATSSPTRRNRSMPSISHHTVPRRRSTSCAIGKSSPSSPWGARASAANRASPSDPAHQLGDRLVDIVEANDIFCEMTLIDNGHAAPLPFPRPMPRLPRFQESSSCSFSVQHLTFLSRSCMCRRIGRASNKALRRRLRCFADTTIFGGPRDMRGTLGRNGTPKVFLEITTQRHRWDVT